MSLLRQLFLRLFRPQQIPVEGAGQDGAGAAVQANARRQRERSMALGIKEYRWTDSRAVECGVARAYDGRVFRYDRPPPEGHPGEARCEADWCRCVARPIVPGLGGERR